MKQRDLKRLGSLLDKLDALTDGKPALRRKIRAKIEARVREILEQEQSTQQPPKGNDQ